MSYRSALLALTALATVASAQADAAFFDIGTYNGGNYSIGKGVNASGEVAGYAGPAQSGPYRGFSFSGGAGRDLTGDFATAPYQTQAQAINASGVIAGTYKPSSTNAQAMIEDHGVATIVPNGFQGADAAFYAINASGTAAGYMRDAATYTLRHAVVYSAGSLTDIGSLKPAGAPLGDAYDSVANGINRNGVVVGVGTTAPENATTGNVFQSSSQRGFVYQNGVMSQIPTLTSVVGASYATAVNDTGYAVGYSPFTSAFLYHAFGFQGGVLTDLGTLAGGNNSEALAVNNLGQAVGFSTGSAFTGQHAALFSNGTVLDLNALGIAPANWTLNIAYGISDTGWITGIGSFPNPAGGSPLQRGFLINLNPVPEPASVAALALGALALVRRRKARRS